jgi:hypothetical protein
MLFTVVINEPYVPLLPEDEIFTEFFPVRETELSVLNSGAISRRGKVACHPCGSSFPGSANSNPGLATRFFDDWLDIPDKNTNATTQVIIIL